MSLDWKVQFDDEMVTYLTGVFEDYDSNKSGSIEVRIKWS